MSAVTVYTNQELIKQLRLELEDLRAKVKILTFQVKNHIIDHKMEEEEEEDA